MVGDTNYHSDQNTNQLVSTLTSLTKWQQNRKIEQEKTFNNTYV
jgi:hypothetical protein